MGYDIAVAHRRRHEAGQDQVPHRGTEPGREPAEDDGRDRSRRPGPLDQDRRPSPQHANHRSVASREARADRPRDARDLRPARSPARHVRDQVGARGPLVRRRFTRNASRRSKGSSSSVSRRRERLLEEVRQEISSKLRDVKIKAEVSGRPKNLYSIYEKIVLRGKQFDQIFDLVGVRVVVDSVTRLLRGPRSAAHRLHAGAGPLQGLHRDAQVQHVPVAAHDGDRAAEAGRWRSRSGRRRCTRRRSPGSPLTGSTSSRRRGKHAEEEIKWLQRMMDWQRESADPKEFMESLKIDLYSGRGLRVHAEGDVLELAAWRDAPRLRLHDPHRGWSSHRRSAGERVGSCRSATSSHRATRSRSSPRRAPASPSRDWLNARPDAACSEQDPAMVRARTT